MTNKMGLQIEEAQGTVISEGLARNLAPQEANSDGFGISSECLKKHPVIDLKPN